jgi:acyl transferase domain-containing protein/NADPH:quinone reductase-like Zn-dependent oxidoreductase/NAD(P)-dependent dehydrogenase (short-subunit alcohol dehydrogenase family)/SAM-dependent methyltransferase/acyl carrier protein
VATPVPIAVIGIGLRLPGGIRTADEFWTSVVDGRDLMTQVPPDRFDYRRYLSENGPVPGRSYTTMGAFLDDVAGFDAEFFGISPLEAGQMDPQQRLMLELAVEAAADAGVDHRSLSGSDTAVFVGITSRGYWSLQDTRPAEVQPYTGAGVISCIAANRVSYFLNTHGPSMALDTACSSSLVAIHQACEVLRSGESRLALAGGVHLTLSPSEYLMFSRASMLSPTGRCHSFGADADGFAIGEGGGLLLLKPLADAIAAGDRVHGVILESVTNNDGATPGLAQPNPRAQQALLERAYAHRDPADLVYLEAHGTGTPVGDPIECQAIGRALSSRRSETLPIGSVKTSVGHLMAGAGVIGTIHALQVLRHGTIPPSPLGSPPNPAIDLPGLGLELLDAPRPVAVSDRSLVGVSAFGFGGSNAHLVLSAPPADQDRRHHAEDRLPIVVSGHTLKAAEDAAVALADQLDTTDSTGFRDVAYTSARRRTQYAHTLVSLASDPAGAASALRALAAGEKSVQWAGRGERVGSPVAFVFCGNGSQWAGMGAGLLKSSAPFRAAVTEVDAAFSPLLGWSVYEAMQAPPETWPITDSAFAQSMLFAVQVGVVAELAAAGIHPAAVVGHSFGEIPAAYVAGCLSMADAARVVVTRNQLQAPLAGKGGMAALGVGAGQARKILADYEGRLELAGINSPQDVTLTGEARALDQMAERFDETGVFFRRLDVDYPFHSRLLDEGREDMLTTLADLKPGPSRMLFASTVRGQVLDGDQLDAKYWFDGARDPVLFEQAVRALAERRFGVFVEIGPHPVLRTYLSRSASAVDGVPPAVLPTLTRGHEDPAVFGEIAARVLAAGAEVDWRHWFPAPGRVVSLPAPAWQRLRHWSGEPDWWPYRVDARSDSHPLLSARLSVVDPTWEATLSPAQVPWLADHRVQGQVVMPGSGLIEMMLAAGHRTVDGPAEIGVLEATLIEITKPLMVPWDEQPTDVRVQTTVLSDGYVRISSQSGPVTASWNEHAHGRVRRLSAEAPARLDLAAIADRLPPAVTGEDLYAGITAAGVDFGPAFRVVTARSADEREALATYRIPGSSPYLAHPAVVDAALQSIAAVSARAHEGVLFLPVSFESVRRWSAPASTGRIHLELKQDGERSVRYDAVICAEDGTVSIELRGIQMRSAPVERAVPPQRYHTVLRAESRHAAARHERPSCRKLLDSTEPARRALRTPRRGFLRTWLGVSAHFFVAAATELLPGATRFTLADLRGAGMLDKHTGVAKVLAGYAAEHGLLRETGAPGADGPSWQIVREGLPREHFRDALRDFPENATRLATLGLCGSHLAGILTGAIDPLHLLFDNQDKHLVESFYRFRHGERNPGQVTVELVKALVREWPADRPLRILEVGAGSGGTTGELLPVLPAERTEYVFTDVSRTFLNAAEHRFGNADFVRYQVLDLEQDPAGQGFTEGWFDLIVAANVLHATKDLTATVEALKWLLADGGHLMAVELADIQLGAPIFGLLDGFWAFTDTTLRPDVCTLKPSQWVDLLAVNGFEAFHVDADQLPDDNHEIALLAGRRDRVHPLPEPTITVVDPIAHIVLPEVPGDQRALRLARLLTDATGREPAVPAAGDLGELLSRTAATVSRIELVLVLGDVDDGGTRETTVRRASVLRRIQRAVDALPDDTEVGLWLICRPSGVFAAPERPCYPVDAAAWGLARTLSAESQMTIKRVSLDCADPDVDLAALTALATEILAPTDDEEIVLTPAGRFVPRNHVTPPARTRAPDPDRAYRLQLDSPGVKPAFSWTEVPTPAAKPDEVVIEVHAAGLNYRDVMIALGFLPDEVPIAEIAGVITEVGSEVRGLAPGDRVMAVSRSSLASTVTARATHAIGIPDSLSFTAAATFPIAFFTAQSCLDELIRLAPGERILIHAAAGGLGLATLQVAQLRGAEVIATAGTPAKRDLLRLLGVQHVLDSRTLDFADQITDLLGPKPIDVVMNSLLGDAATRSLELLGTGGRFVELGKRDLYADAPLRLRPFLRDISYFAFQGDTRLFAEGSTPLAKIAGPIGDGTYHPLPHRVFPAAKFAEAFELLQHSRHIGKIVVDLTVPPPVVVPPAPLALRATGTYLVTGGLSGFGAATARYLVKHGARHLALVGRRGTRTPEARELVAELSAHGTECSVFAADVTDPAAMRSVFDTLAADGRQLRGVVHSAMHLDDDALTDLSDERVRAILAPKIDGTEILNHLTRDEDLDFLLLYSSISTLIALPLQSPYVAACLFLEASVRARQAADTVGTSVAWGSIGDVGWVARHSHTETMLGLGILPMTAVEALGSLPGILRDNESVAAVARIDWARLGRTQRRLDRSLHRLLLPRQSAAGITASFKERLANAPDGRAVVSAELIACVADALHTSPETIDPAKSLDRLGVDSLMAMELATAIRGRLDCDVRPLEITASADLHQLAHRIATLLGCR